MKLHLTRAINTPRPDSSQYMTQRLELAADRDGRLTALRHHVSNITGLVETYVEGATEVKELYACPAIDTAQEVERVSVGAPTPMRTTNEGCGLWALESAMNELAHELGIDPLELRLRNTPMSNRQRAGRGPPSGCARPMKRGRSCSAGTNDPRPGAGTVLADRHGHGHLDHGASALPR